ncbi:MAG: hypothetical protein GQF41_3001 [Candidatus Rifleibacterium amylolyticum]|nr:MAG: hypothetical protein GQF41_3001 [Candidatus Rifleibacterium amylolyticum]
MLTGLRIIAISNAAQHSELFKTFRTAEFIERHVFSLPENCFNAEDYMVFSTDISR